MWQVSILHRGGKKLYQVDLQYISTLYRFVDMGGYPGGPLRHTHV